MAPPNTQKRVKGVQIFRPFIYGTTARLFNDDTNPKPPGTPEDHTHSWTVFVKGVDDADITYWCKKVQFKLHESIPNPLRSTYAAVALPLIFLFPLPCCPCCPLLLLCFVEPAFSDSHGAHTAIENVAPGDPFEVHETGWGEFEITVRMFYVPESLEKPQSFYHGLRLHAFGDTEEQKEEMRKKGEVAAWAYEEMVFNEPYENFYELLTSPMERSKGSKGGGGLAKGTRLMKGGMVGSVGSVLR